MARILLCAALVLACLWFPATSAEAAHGRRLAIGDSITLGAAPQLRSRGFRVNAKVGRQFSTATGIVRSYGRSLPRNVVLALGTNGRVSLARCRAAVRATGESRRVFLVNNRMPRSWEAGNNRRLRACANSFARVHLVDWHRASAGHRNYFAADRVHLTRAGSSAFARLIDRAVDRSGR